jgi:hypothetical protein
MKSSTMRLMIAAAALVVAAGTASAQTYKAEIPMAFRAAGKLMAPGSYEIRVSRNSATELLYVRNTGANATVVLLGQVKTDPPKEWRQAGNPKLAFTCTAGACSLSRMWDGSDSYAYRFPAPKAQAGDLAATRSELVTLSMIKAH